LFFESTERMMTRSVCSRLWQIAIILGIGLLQVTVAPELAQAQVGEYFQFPSWGGSVIHPFDDLHAAVEGKYHTGWDISLPGNRSTYILASAYGVVDSVTKNDGNDHGMGNCVIIRHKVVVNSKGGTAIFYTLYAHMDSVNVRAGQSVSGGDIIGIMGCSGHKDPYYWKVNHLHFEVKVAGVTSTPNPVNAFWGYTPRPAEGYGYINPADVINNWYVIK
jgi:murein DD-endopeptidase MepM/ murein hydrolase activator NlpD